MVKPDKVQQALLDLLKAYSPLVALVGEEIRERNYMSRTWKYPAVRLQIRNMGPRSSDNGECRPLIAQVSFTVLCYTDSTSSKDCLQLSYAAASALQGKRAGLAGELIPVTRIDLPESGFSWPVSEGDRLWRAEFQGRVTVKQLGFPPDVP